jgi:DNA-binding FadR family transcriptional regulator
MPQGEPTTTARQTKAVVIAERVQQGILSASVVPGTVIGSEAQLCEKYRVGRTAFREATRILQFRGVARMKRGPNGGLVVTASSHDGLLASLATLLQADEAAKHLSEARCILTSIASRLSPGSRVDDETPPREGVVSCPMPRSNLSSLAARSRNPALTSIASTLESLCRIVLRPEEGRRASELQNDMPLKFGSSRAGSIARHVSARIRMSALPEGTRIGSEADLCERHAVGIPVARQVIRLLEESGDIDCRRGRGRGLFVRKPGTESVTHALASSLVNCGATTRESWMLGHLLNVEIVVLAAAHGVPPQSRQSLLRLMAPAAGRAPTDAADILAIDRIVDECAPNPILLTILLSLKTYSRLRNPHRDITLTRYASVCGPEFLASTRAVAGAILSGDGRAVGQAQRHKNALFFRRVAHSAPSASWRAAQ